MTDFRAVLAHGTSIDRLCARFAAALTPVCANHDVGTILAALTGNLVAAIKAGAPPSEWRAVGDAVADEIRRHTRST